MIQIIREELQTFYEGKEKGKEILYKLKTKVDATYSEYGKTKSYTYDAYITDGKDLGNDKYGGKIFSISTTPGAGYVSTLMSHKGNDLSIYGRAWTCHNFNALGKEVKTWLKTQNESLTEANKFTVTIDQTTGNYAQSQGIIKV